MSKKKTIDGKQKIKSAIINDFKGVSHVEIDVKETNLFLIGGKNGNGKSSVLDALATAIGGKKRAMNPVANGKTRAEIEVVLDDLKISMNIQADGKIEPTVIDLATRKKVTSPKKVLRSMFGDFAMDPGAFQRLETRDQVAALRAITVDKDGKPVTFDDLDTKHEELYGKRREEKRVLVDKKANLTNYPKVEDAPAKEVSSADLIDELEAANDHNNELTRLDQVIESKVRASTALEQEADRLKKALKKAESDLKIADKAVDTAKDTRKKAGKPQDTSAIEEKLKGIEDINATWRAAEAHTKARAECDKQEKVVAKIEKDMLDLADERKKRLESSRFPVDGLTFDDSGIKYNGVPFEDACSAEKLRISFLIALAGRPQMPIVFIDNGELLDDESVEVFKAEAEKLDAQVFMAAGSRLEHYDMFLEDGKVK